MPLVSLAATVPWGPVIAKYLERLKEVSEKQPMFHSLS